MLGPYQHIQQIFTSFIGAFESLICLRCSHFREMVYQEAKRIGTIFAQSDAAATINFTALYCIRVITFIIIGKGKGFEKARFITATMLQKYMEVCEKLVLTFDLKL